MSLQNLLKSNNYELDISYVSSGQIHTTDLYSISPSTNITTHANIITNADDAVNLGGVGKGYANIYARNLAGLNGAVNVQYGITGEAGVNPLKIYNNGLIFFNPASTSDNSTMNYYREFSGTLTTGGALPSAATGGYRAVICGKNVNISITFPATVATSTAPITLTGLPSQFIPGHVQSSLAPANNGGVISMGIIKVDTAALLTLYTDTIETGNFTNGSAAGLGVASGRYFSFSYTLN